MNVRRTLERRHTLILIALLAVITLAVTYSTIEFLYRTAVAQERIRLHEMAESQARLIEAIARDEQSELGDPALAEAATLELVRAFHSAFQKLGTTGEFTLARLDGDRIVFLLDSRYAPGEFPEPASLGSDLAEPMQKALRGESGTMVGRDYRGVTVVAAYEPVAVLDLGIVAKIDLVELQAPYVRSAYATLGPALVAILLGAWAFTRVTRPVVRRIKETQQRYEDIVEMMGDGLAVQDTKGKLIYVNDRLCRMLGARRRDLVGRPALDFYLGDSREEYLRQMELRRAGVTKNYEATLRRRDGNGVSVWLAPRPLLDTAGKYAGSFAVISEITDLKAAEERLREEKERAQQYLDVVGVLVVVLDLEGQIQLINRRGVEILGYERDTELVGKDWFETCIPSSRRDEVRRVFAALMGGRMAPFERFENPVITQRGDERLVFWHNVFLRDPDGRILGMLSSGDDVTDRRRDEQELRRRALQLETVSEVTRTLTAILDVDDLLDDVVGAIADRLGFSHVDVFLMDPSGESVTLRAGSRLASPAWRGRELSFRVGQEGMIGWVAASGEPRLANDVSQDSLFVPDPLLSGTKSELVVPIRREDCVLGVLDVQDDAPGAFSPGDATVLSALCAQLAVAIETARLYGAIEESERRYRRLIDEVPVMVYDANERCEMVSVNPRVEDISGYSADDFMARRVQWCDLIHPEDRSGVLQAAATLHAAPRELTQVYRIMKKDGMVAWVEDSKTSTQSDDGRLVHIHGIVRDTTARRRAEREQSFLADVLGLLNRSAPWKETIRSILEAIKTFTGFDAIGIRLVEDDDFPYFATNGFPAHFVEAERFLCARRDDGSPERDEEGRAVLRCMCGNVLRGRTDPTLPFFTEGGSFWSNHTTRLLAETSEAERQARTRNLCNSEGYESVALVPLRTEGETIGLLQLNDRRGGRFDRPMIRFFERVGTAIAIAFTRKRTENALRESEDRHRSLVENAVLGIYQTTPSGRIVSANPALVKMLGYDSFEELAARDLEVEGYEPYYSRRAFKERIARNGIVTGQEARWRRKDGSFLTVRENAVAVRDAEGKTLSYDGTVEDITARREAEQAKERLEAQLRQTQKLESIGTLASGIAHEINNPLTGIINYADLIRTRTGDGSLREFAAGIIDEGNRVAKIVRNLLSFARQEKESHSPARMIDIVEASLSLIGAVLRKDGIEVDVDVPEDLPSFKCRSQQIQQVVMNLLTNARDTLNARFPGRDARKTLAIRAERSVHDARAWIRLTVEDHGTGIPEAIRTRIFDPFFTTKSRDQGTGLGLSISYGIVRDHHGTLSVESEENVYTRFAMELPIDNGWNLSAPQEATSEEGT